MLSAQTKSFGWNQGQNLDGSVHWFSIVLPICTNFSCKREISRKISQRSVFQRRFSFDFPNVFFFFLISLFLKPLIFPAAASKSKRVTSHTANSLKCLPVSHSVWELQTVPRVSRSLSAERGKTKWFGEKEAIKGEKGGRGRTVNHWQIMPHAKLSWIKHPPSLAVAPIQVFSLPAFASSLTSLSLTRMINPRRP